MMARGLLIATFVMILDQLTKWWMLSGLDLLNRAPIEVTSFFNLVTVWNRGISFGMFSRNPEDLRWLLIGLATAVSFWLIHWLKREKSRFVAIALGLIIGGALANVVDRIRFGAVFDFLDFHLASWHYPAFNVADSAIVMGVLCLLLDGFRRSPR